MQEIHRIAASNLQDKINRFYRLSQQDNRNFYLVIQINSEYDGIGYRRVEGRGCSMEFDKALIAGKLRRWEKYINTFRLPAWDSIPDIGLYMEQVLSLLRDYFNYIPPELVEEELITPAAINNYVRKKIMPEPVKKKYYRLHIAYLIMICLLKQTLSIPMIQRFMPFGMSEEEARIRYDRYIALQHVATENFVEGVRGAAGKILDHADAPAGAADDTEDLVVVTVIYGGLAHLLAEKLLRLEGKTLADGGSISLEVT